ncbi:MAG: altronate dehydratase large subunit, partial [Candidatus Latescibacterota bacterium]
GGLTPVIKIIANPNRMQLIADNADNADFDATPIIRGEQSIEQVGEQLYEEIITELGDKSSPLV